MSRYIHGFHAGSLHDGYGSTGAQNMEDRPGWIVFTEIAGIDGGDYSLYHDWGFGVLVRLNHGYFPNGTIPERGSYPDFAITCAQHVKNSVGVDGWIIGNEPNHSQERPSGQSIYALDYADCFRMCRDAIKAETPGAQVIVGGVAPYNAETGDFRSYFGAVLQFLDGGYDGVCLHAYTHGADPALITDEEQMMGAPLTGAHYHFRVYRDLMESVPDGVPAYITETDQNDPWTNENRGWVREMYREVNEWNEDHPQRVIRCACLYRYPPFDQWVIAGKGAVIEDFNQAVDIGYTWTDTEPEPPEPEPEPPEEEPMITIGTEPFDGLFAARNDPNTGETNVGELKVQVGWTPFWVWQGLNPADPSLLRRPEFFISHGDDLTNSDDLCQAVQTTFSTTDCCVWKQYTTSPGATLRATVRAMLDSAAGAQNGTQIGIDPLGGTDMFSDSVAWSSWLGQDPATDKKWQTLTRDGVIAQSTKCTVFLRAKTDYAMNSATHWDDFKLEADIGEPEPEPEPEPDPTPDPIGDLVRIRVLINEDTVYDQSFQAVATTLRLEPVSKLVAGLVRMFRK